jgi:RNA polymerase sigma-70 factor, ECF subfamily
MVGWIAVTMDPSLDVGRLRRQDSVAFEQLVRQHQGVVAGLAQSLGLRGPDVEDAAAETFAQVYRALPSFEGRSALGTWVYQIAVRTLRRYRTRRNRLGKMERSTDDPPDQADDERRERSPAQSSIDRETHERLWAAVARLEPRQAMAVELCYRRGWGLEQIAQTLACPVGTIKTLLFRAREELRRTLKVEEMSP